MPNNGSRTHFEVAVIGAGQAGLAIGCLLARQDRRFVILDGADSIGAAWRHRWDSLVLFTPRRYDSLPGLAFPGDPDGYPTRDEVVAYLEQYARTFELPIQLANTVRSLATRGRAFELELDDHGIEADQVVVATGPFQTPRVPSFASHLAPELFQTHSLGYGRSSDLPHGTALVVGGGRQIVLDPGVGQQPGKAGAGQRHRLPLQGAAVQGQGVAGPAVERGDLVHDAGAGADESVLRALAE